MIRRLTLDRLRIVAAREPDGRWNLASLVRRDTQRNRRRGPGARFASPIEITDGSVSLLDPLAFGAAHIPARFEHLNTTLSFAYQPVTWTLDFSRASYVGTEPDLTVTTLSGVVANGDAGWAFDKLHVVTPRSEFTLDGRIDRRQTPTTLELNVSAPRFAFQEWSGVLHGLSNIAVESAFDAQPGPPAAMGTTIALRSNGGDVKSDLVLDTTVPGWHAKGTATVQRLDLARWLNRPDRPSDISGAVDMDLTSSLGVTSPAEGSRFEDRTPLTWITRPTKSLRGAPSRRPRCASRPRRQPPTARTFAWPAAPWLSTPLTAFILSDGKRRGLRQVPRDVPVPHVESTLAFDYDVTGQFAMPFIRGSATFAIRNSWTHGFCRRDRVHRYAG